VTVTTGGSIGGVLRRSVGSWVFAMFIFLGQAGTTVKGAYNVLVSMSIISYFIPYRLMLPR
jgi:hypothetical protein